MENEAKEISAELAKERAERGALFVDVREKYELAETSYNVPNIVNIPLSELSGRLTELPRDRELIIVCRSGNRSLIAANFLLQQGFTSVVSMAGGIIDWEEKNFPVK